jgi:geranylgeranyl diphosphate synthase type I
MTTPVSLNALFHHYIPRIEAEMRDVINAGAQPAQFNTMLNYHLGFANADGSPAQVNAGKRIRPVLVLLSCEACGGAWEQALPAAAAVELLHNFSLIHDDIEDRDELRRGRPTLWRQWGEAQAINSGDAMFAMAHLALLRSEARGVPAAGVVRALRAFDDMCVHLTVGQHLDLSFETRSDVSAAEYMTMIEGKTAALTAACCQIGAIIAGASDAQINALRDFGRWIGMSFQLQDDVLGIWGDPEKTGKQDSDLAHRKKTLPILFAAERDARIRERYFGNSGPDDSDLNAIREMIEAAGGREHAEQAAESAYAKALESLDSAGGHAPLMQSLRDLAHSLLGRAH